MCNFNLNASPEFRICVTVGGPYADPGQSASPASGHGGTRWPTRSETAAVAERIGTLLERSSKLWAGSLDRSVETAGKRLKPDPLNAVPAMSKIVNDYIEHPQKMFEATAR